MFLNMRRSKDKGVPPVEPGKDSAEQKVQQIESLEEMVARRTQGLKEAQEQLSQLVLDSAPKEEKPGVDALFEQPKPPAEAVKLEEIAVKSIDLNALIKPEETAPVKEAVAAPVVEKKPEAKAQDDSMADLFNQEDEKENPLAGLIRSLPVVSASELLNEAKEVSVIIREWRR